MKAKLIKTDSNYYLYVDGKIIASTEFVEGKQKLSKQNCDELFGVFDVESWIKETLNDADVKDELMLKTSKMCLKAGFNKAMELNKDKVFTLEDMKKAINLAYVIGKSDDTYQECEKFVCEQLQSIKQPTEIEVELEMVKTPDAMFQFHDVPYSTPKLDSEGYLILKKI